MARKIRLTDFHCTRSYGEWMMGRPPPESLIHRAQARIEPMWGTDRPILVLPPKRTPVGVPPRTWERVPEWCMSAWLESDRIGEDANNDFSHLIVIWWGDAPSLDLPSIDEETWRANARDSSF